MAPVHYRDSTKYRNVITGEEFSSSFVLKIYEINNDNARKFLRWLRFRNIILMYHFYKKNPQKYIKIFPFLRLKGIVEDLIHNFL